MTFTTFRLGDALPMPLAKAWKRERAHWLVTHPKPWSSQEQQFHDWTFIGRLHRWLDRGMGSCRLRDASAVEMVIHALLHYEQQEEWYVDSWVIMPNHVHALVQPIGDATVEQILKSLKRYTARKLNAAHARRGSVWQSESYDHLVRNAGEFWHYREYIRANPVRSRLNLPSEALQVARHDEASMDRIEAS